MQKLRDIAIKRAHPAFVVDMRAGAFTQVPNGWRPVPNGRGGMAIVPHSLAARFRVWLSGIL